MRTLLLALLSASLLLVASAPAQSTSLSQNQASEATGAASLRGTITDPSGALVSNADLLLHSVNSNILDHAAITTRDGRYDIANIAPGTYTLRVTAPGFAEFESKPIRFANRPYIARKFNLTLAIEADNAPNFVNRAPPIGVLGSPLFGKSNALAANSADSSTAGGNANRVVNLVLFTRF